MLESGLSKENYFTFQLGTGIFAIPVTSVKEVINYDTITPVPKALPYLKGVINIRGSVITVADLRVLFNFAAVRPIEKNNIIVTEIAQPGELPMVLGILADTVDVVSKLQLVPAENIDYGALPNRKDFIAGIAKKDSTFVLILDLEKILASIKEEMEAVRTAPVKLPGEQ